jgi:hypothetical protein
MIKPYFRDGPNNSLELVIKADGASPVVCVIPLTLACQYMAALSEFIRRATLNGLIDPPKE